MTAPTGLRGLRVAHLTTVASSLRYLLLAQLRAVIDGGGTAIGISAPGADAAYLEAAGIRHIALSHSSRRFSLVSDLRAAWQLFRVLRRERVDVLHTHNPKPGLYGRVVGRLAGVPIVVNTVHGLYATEQDPWPKRLAVYGLEALAARFSDAELIQNPEDLELLRRWHVVPSKRLVLLGNGIDLARFHPGRVSPEERGSIRRELGAHGKVLIGTVGRLVAEKGYHELFGAVAELGDDYALVVIGPEDPHKSDALPGAVMARAEGAGVVFLGHRDDVDRLYGALDIFVLPSHREGFPRAAMEAAAMGLAVVATDVRGCRQVVEHGTSGLLVPVRDQRALAAALRHLGEDAAVRARMGAAGAARARRSFDQEHVLRIVVDTYREIAVRKRRRVQAAQARRRQARP